MSQDITMSIQIIMSKKEQKYEEVCIALLEKSITLREGAYIAHISEKQMRRILKKYQEGGARALCHKSRGTRGRPQFPPNKKREVINIIRSELSNYTPAHIKDTLAYTYKIVVSVPTIRTWMRAEELLTSKKPPSRSDAHRTWRAPKPQFGMMLQADGSFHQWFGKDFPPCCLLVLIDDATNIIHVRFAEQEYASDMLILLKNWVSQFGIPQSLYFDKRNAYVDNEQQTQYIPQVCARLGIDIINAHSPQAKGRVERVNFTLQQRLGAELHRHRITSIKDANEYVHYYYHDFHNACFSHPPLIAQDIQDAHVPVLNPHSLDALFAFSFLRTLRNDYTITIDAYTFQIIPSSHKRIPRRAKITCKRYLDNSLHLFYNDTKLSFKEVVFIS